MEGPWITGESCARSLGVRTRQKQGLSKSHVALGQDEESEIEIQCRIYKAA